MTDIKSNFTTHTYMTFGSIRDDIVDHLKHYIATNGTDCEDTQILKYTRGPKSSLIVRILKTNIQPPCTNAVIFSLSIYTSPSKDRLEYIESDEEEKPDSEVVESSPSSADEDEDDTSANEDIGDDETDFVSLVPLSHSDEIELARMVHACGG